MKKLLLALLGFLIIFIIVQKFGLLTYLPKNFKSPTENQPTEIPTVDVSQSTNQPIIGIHYRMINKQTADQNKLIEGAYITQVIKNSPAERANLKEEDIIIEVDGRSITGLEEQSVYNLISTLKPGAKVNLKIWRNKEVKNVFVTLD